jgi:hypothetical protein
MIRKCEPLTADMYPDKLTYKEYCKIIRESLDDFEENMKILEMKEMYVEDWMRCLAGWEEMT